MNLATATQISTTPFVSAPNEAAPLPSVGRCAMAIHFPFPVERLLPRCVAALANQELVAAAARSQGISVFRVSRPTARVSAVDHGDETLTMWRDDAFSRTDLADRLSSAGRDCLVIVGGHAQIECLATATRAVREGFCPVLVTDALVDTDEFGATATARYVAAIGGRVCTSEELLAQWQGDERGRTTGND